MSDSQESGRSSMYVFHVAFVAAIGGFLFGFDLGMIGAANVYLRDQFQLNDAQLGLATGSAVLGCMFGPFLGAWLCDAIGRKTTMIVASFLLAVSAVVTAVPDILPGMSDQSTMVVFNVFRVVGGVGRGTVLDRLSHVHRRGGSARETRPSGTDVSTGDRRGTHRRAGDRLPGRDHAAADRRRGRDCLATAVAMDVRIRDGLCAVVCHLRILPCRAVRVGWPTKAAYDDALAVLTRIDGPDYAKREIEEIRASLDQETGGWGELFAPGMRYALLIGILLALFNNWTGWSVIGGYIPMLFEMSGLEDRARRSFSLPSRTGSWA